MPAFTVLTAAPPSTECCAWVRIRCKSTAGRNDACPCGSGVKFEYCHGG
ncbi:SEC-C metal-binding domain-containing protein [Cupriavidus sp. RAF12]